MNRVEEIAERIKNFINEHIFEIVTINCTVFLEIGQDGIRKKLRFFRSGGNLI